MSNYTMSKTEEAATTRWLALGAIASPVVLTVAWIVLGMLRPATKDAWGVSGGITGMITQPFSGLGIGPNASLFNAAFVVSGLLLLVGVLGVFRTVAAPSRPAARKVCLLLLALSGLGMVVCGVFTLESFFLHMLGFLLGCFTPVVSFLAMGLLLRGIPIWRKFGTWLIVGSPLTLLLLVLYFATFHLDTMAAGRGVAGLTERILFVEVMGWFVAMGWLAMRLAPRLTRIS